MFFNAGHSDKANVHVYKGQSGLVIRHLTVGFLVPVRVNASVRGNWLVFRLNFEQSCLKDKKMYKFEICSDSHFLVIKH